MADFGFRISQSGSDVKSCTDLQCVVTSKNSNLKGALSGTASIVKTADNQTKTVIAHNLGYIPIVQCSLQESVGTWIQLPYLYTVSCYADATNVYIHFISGISNATYPVKYFIYLDKGKL